MPQVNQTQMTPERIAEIKDLLRYESSIAFYSSRAKESMLLLVDEAEEAAKLRKRVAELEANSVPDETEYAVRMPDSNNIWPRREFREIGQWERILADGGVLLERVIRRGPWVKAPNQCPGFEGNPVAPDQCAGCGETSDNHEAVAS